MTDILKGYSSQELLNRYDFQDKLTMELDDLDASNLNREKLYEIILWKLSRFPDISDELIHELRCVVDIKPGDHRKVESLLKRLLECKGIALPMASTILRFQNPRTFQIIDDRVYRILFPGELKYPSKPAKVSNTYLDRSIVIYFLYLDKLHTVCGPQLSFKDSDRILYQLDIELGNRIGQK